MKAKHLLKKIVLTTVVVANICTGLMAAEGKTLTLEHAIASGIDNEGKFGVMSKKIDAYEAQLKSAGQSLESDAYHSANYQLNDARQQKEFIKDKVAYNVTKLYHSIVVKKDEIALAKSGIDLLEKQLKQAELKFEKGYISQLELTKVQKDLEDQVARLKNSETALEDLEKQFLNLTNINIKNYDSFEADTECKPLEYENGVNTLITLNVDKYMKYREEYVETQKGDAFELAVKASGGVAPTATTYYTTKADLAEREYSTEKARKDLTEQLNSTYAALEQLQKSIDMQQASIDYNKKQLDTLKVKYNKGLACEIDVEEAEYNLSKLEAEYEKSAYSYQEQKMLLETPWAIL